ncbi:MAG: hypothetical protein A2Y97_06270 [Nitrospirae bacterium RBG_13_39_12]|nr:MAG: hypothetical protein A2Y97_06270 [Nitrospirae bacterium RBG_13_39_12]
MKQWIELPKDKRKNDFEFTVDVIPNERTTIEHQPGQFVTILKLEIKARATVDTTPLRLKPGRYLGEKVAYGSADNIFPESNAPNEKVLITLIAKDGQLDSGALMIPKFQGKGKSVFSITVAPSKDDITNS